MLDSDHTTEHDDKTDEIARVPLGRVLALFGPYRYRIAAIAALIILGAAVGLTTPFLLRAIIDKALPAVDMGLLSLLVAALIGAGAVSAAINATHAILSSRIGQAIMHDLRVRVYGHLQSLSLGFFTHARAGEIQSRIANDIGGLQSLVTNTAHELARNLSLVLMTAIAMVLLDWRLALFSITIIPIVVYLSDRVGEKREAYTQRQQERMADLSSTVQETLSISGIILARTMGRNDFLVRRFTRTSADVGALEVRSSTAGEWQWQLIYLLLDALPALTLLLGGWLISQNVAITIGTLVAMIALQEQLLWPLQELLRTGLEIRTTRALFARVFDYLDRPVEIVERPDAIAIRPERMRGAVTIENVSFAYDKGGEPTLRNVSIDIPAGSHVAIVGATGSGKTTLGYLLARLYDVDQGAIRFDGVDIRDLKLSSLTDMLGVVTQEPYLLNASIADNLRFAKPHATQAELAAAARAAQISKQIEALPEGYKTIVGERGYRFSGGEKQRLALARTILRDPPILLLDEATSALDTRTEQAMSAALASLSKGRTTITIAHRLSTVRSADMIVVMQHGRVVESGTHEVLMAQGGAYAALLHPDRA
ncbi:MULTISPECIES: ABC transporter ATP-binding protein [unclassified Sphingobium]|uniref:ABC transporter ATP-binding protein n=1 Tax=unclassified Sphingobium TaxID=2611147 RepID=UPI002224C997|nr:MULTISPECIES: ABC transporter ATP-binding protein [unclassified Sphingobium]MCW2395754.1 ATP-binding cassette subfamily B protein [Sphingobium sp. B8D3B]MCW2419269.1 ATP-binding cassette subfamily B protein [Sphingobium sp. B8D3C]